VKIDTVGLGDANPVKQSYLELRGQDDNNAPFVATLPATEGLEMDMAGLLDWSAAAIAGFKLNYDDVAQRLGLRPGLDQARLLPHFKVNSSFKKLQPGWDDETTGLFVRFANAINSMEFDWWTTKPTNWPLRFGQKEKNKIKGRPIGALSLRETTILVRWEAFANLDELPPTELTEELVQIVEEAELDGGSWPTKLGPRTQRTGFWPDDFNEAEIADENDTDDAVVEPSAAYDMAVVPKNQIYYGPPGTGKTYKLNKLLKDYTITNEANRFEFVTFHQSFGYEEFIEGLRPVIGQDDAGQVHYEIKPGAFLRLCERARKDKARKYAIVIDEINRGNVSKIFGELITLLEPDKREGAEHAISVTLPYSSQPFSVPWNVDVIGTMNTADRSLALVDTALRRRFDFIEVMPNATVLESIIMSVNGVTIDIARILTTLNARIEALYDREHTIGHAYFEPLRPQGSAEKAQTEAGQMATLRAIFQNRIIPLLEEYFFDDWHKIRLVLGDNQKKGAQFQFIAEIDQEQDMAKLFGSGTELDQYQLTKRYQRNTAALDQPLAYVGIYDPSAANAAQPA
jgi:5-methylcytosine-specific restriction protein B